MKRYLIWLFTFFLLLGASGTIVASPSLLLLHQKVNEKRALAKVQKRIERLDSLYPTTIKNPAPGFYDEFAVDAKSQYYVGIKYFEIGDYKNAVHWFEKAAKQGVAEAQYNLGQCYYDGRGVAKDDTKAAYWYEKAANQGIAPAQNNLGLCYYSGEGVAKDYDKAAYWFEKSAKQGYKLAHQNLQELRQELEASSRSANDKQPNKPKQVADNGSNSNVENQGNDRIFIDENIPVTNMSSENTFAVVIGNENYQRVTKVPFAVNDAKVVAAYCEKTLGLPKENIRTYTDATFGAMVEAVDWIRRVAAKYKGQLNVVFYYSGHGIPDDRSREAYMLPVDADGLNTRVCYPLKELYSELASMGAQRVLVLLDACFSGATKGSGMIVQAKGTAIKPKDDVIGGNMIVFSAASGKETAYPYIKAQHGLFTYYLLKKINETKGRITIGELSEYVKDEVGKKALVVKGKDQTPTVTVSDSMLNSWQSQELHF